LHEDAEEFATLHERMSAEEAKAILTLVAQHANDKDKQSKNTLNYTFKIQQTL
jgi:hypothetical protein